MCLLVTQPANAPALSDAWLTDFYYANADGVGVMYAQDGELVVEKILPVDEEDFIHFYRNHIEGKDCAFHLRMKTHGNIDMENCHPYEVLNHSEHGISLWLMHNGVLSTGNKADETKSDTWHYIRDYLRPMLADNPEFAFHPAFSAIIGDHIGSSNKFVLMDNNGRQVTINEDAGVYWGGLWLSNTYAWSASKSASKTYVNDIMLAHEQVAEEPMKYTSTYNYGFGSYGKDYGYSGTWSDDYYDYDYPVGGISSKAGKAYADEVEVLEMDIDDICTEFGIASMTRAEKFSRRQVWAFIDKFGFSSWLEVAYMALDKDIDEDSYIKMMSDFAYAREMFPFLSKEEQTLARGKWVN
jgi:hypothetical protein